MGRGRTKTMFPRPNCGARLCTDLSPFPEQCATSQPNSTFLSLPYSSALMPQQLLYTFDLTSIAQSADEPVPPSASSQWCCISLRRTQLWRNDYALRLQTFWDTHAGSTSSNRHFYLLAPLLLLFLFSGVMHSFCVDILLDAAVCHKVICKIIITLWDEERRLTLNWCGLGEISGTFGLATLRKK